MADTLKPCPICGGTNLATSYCVCTNMDHELMPDTVHMHVFDLYCKECGCRVQAGGDAFDEAKDAVFEKWNRRVERTCQMSVADNGAYRCSECGHLQDDTYRGDKGWYPPEYCAHCGARVVEE